MEWGPKDLLELRRASDIRPAWFLDLVQPEIGGGKFDPSQFWALDENPAATALRVSGLDQSAFERLVSDHGHRFQAIEFWKCPRIDDLAPLEDLSALRMVSFYWNQRSPRLWNLARTPDLTALRFEDFTRLHRLDDLLAGKSLEELAFGDAVWAKSTFETLEPLAMLTGLRNLSLHPKRIDDDRVQPLGALTKLEKLSIPMNLFTTEQIAWLRARLPETVESSALAALLRFEKPLELDGKSRDVLLIGKRKPFLNSELDADRISKHVRLFEKMVNSFRNDPAAEPA
jgi:hypothetical protein